MSMRTQSFPTGTTPPEIEVRTHAGTVSIEADSETDALDVRVEALDDAAEQLLDEVEIDARPGTPRQPAAGPRPRAAAPPVRDGLVRRHGAHAGRCPRPGVRHVGGGGRRGPMGRLDLTGASGDLEVEDCSELHARSASGDVRVGVVTGPASVASASGDVHVGRATGGLQGRTASGDIEIGEAAGDVSLTTASGDLDLGAATAGSVHVRSMSGDATVGVVPGLRVWLDLSSASGRMESQLDEDAGGGDEGAPQLSVTMRSFSGDLRVRRAAAAPH